MVTFDFKRTGMGLQRIIDGLPGAAERGVRRALDNTAKLAIRMAPNIVGKCIKVEMLNSETGEIVGRVYTDTGVTSFAPYVEFGTGVKVDDQGNPVVYPCEHGAAKFRKIRISAYRRARRGAILGRRRHEAASVFPPGGVQPPRRQRRRREARDYCPCDRRRWRPMNDPLHTLNQAELAVMFWQAVVDSGLFPEEESVMLENPSTRAVFPCCTLSVPLARPLYMGSAYDISITVEVWADKQLDAVRLFEQLRTELEKLNLRQTGNVPSQQDDITEKWRFGGYFEVRWNAIDNTFERNN